MTHLIELLYLMLPVYCANMAPPFAKFWRGWNRPICEKHLGSHKTVMGFALGVLAAMLVAFIQSRIEWSGNLLSYEHWPALGLATGLGAMLGDSMKSFFKRRMKIAPGRPWLPYDQLDFVVGGLLMLSVWVRLSLSDLAWIIAFSFTADIVVNHLSFYLHVRDTKW